ncbi:MAG: histidinol-phosphatase HisJ family protein [Candidatus Lokiarchaeota archaeon]|nr:histidinol-phosphatase HisJ family protein [Candidatus Lokiarchaeota archaeon]
MKFKYTDYHVHTKWSSDIQENGPVFDEYIEIAELNEINICFLEHYELHYIERDKTNPFYNDKIDDYLEEIDQLKENYNIILSGLEVEYYRDRESELMEFMDDYGKDLDFISGTVHEWIYNYPITSRAKLIQLLEKVQMKQVIDDYFETNKMMIESKIFKNVCHIDTIYRYINENDLVPLNDCNISDERVLNLGRLCIKNKIRIEYNLSGVRFPIKRSFPSKEVAKQLKLEGAKFFIGSDSHSLEFFEETIPKLKQAYEFLGLTN